jgi:hypothetical protein
MNPPGLASWRGSVRAYWAIATRLALEVPFRSGHDGNENCRPPVAAAKQKACRTIYRSCSMANGNTRRGSIFTTLLEYLRRPLRGSIRRLTAFPRQSRCMRRPRSAATRGVRQRHVWRRLPPRPHPLARVRPHYLPQAAEPRRLPLSGASRLGNQAGALHQAPLRPLHRRWAARPPRLPHRPCRASAARSPPRSPCRSSPSSYSSQLRRRPDRHSGH